MDKSCHLDAGSAMDQRLWLARFCCRIERKGSIGNRRRRTEPTALAKHASAGIRGWAVVRGAQFRRAELLVVNLFQDKAQVQTQRIAYRAPFTGSTLTTDNEQLIEIAGSTGGSDTMALVPGPLGPK